MVTTQSQTHHRAWSPVRVNETLLLSDGREGWHVWVLHGLPFVLIVLNGASAAVRFAFE